MTANIMKPQQWFKTLLNISGNKAKKGQNVVHPCMIDGREAMVYEQGLRENNPVFYAQLKQFSKVNNIFLKEDQRNSFDPVKNDRRSKFMPMMVLGASLLTNQTANAANKNHNAEHNHFQADQTIERHVDQFNSGFSSQEEHNIAALLGWVRDEVSHLDFEVGTDMPSVKRVSNGEMLKVAFGKNMPRAVNQKNMQIYGLYNFRNGTIYLLDSIDLETEKGKSILLHELVHYLQYQNGHNEKVDCKNQLEHLAYNLEAKYLQAHGERVDFSQNHVRRVSQCG